MPRLLKLVLSFLVLTVSLYIDLASPAPYNALHKRQQTTPLLVQANSWTNDHSPALGGGPPPSTFALPPVSDVFKALANPAPQHPVNQPPPPNNPPPAANNPPQNPPPPPVHNPPPPPHNPPPPPAVHPTPTPPSTHPIHAEPPYAAPHEEAKEELTSNQEHAPSEADHRKNLAPVGKLILIALVMAGIITLIFCIYFLVDRRALACCCRRRRSRRNKPQRLEDTAEEPKVVTTPPAPWVKFSPPAPQDQMYSYEQNRDMLPPRTVQPPPNEAINMVPSLPPSRRAVIAKPYPFAARGASFSSTAPPPAPTPKSPLSRAPYSPPPMAPLPDPPMQAFRGMPPAPESPVQDFRRARRSSTPAPLLPPSEFFCMPSASDMTLHGHSRIKSNPIFGHIGAHCLPEIKLRSGEHRKSKSVSGLVYVVNTDNGKGREDAGYGMRSGPRSPF